MVPLVVNADPCSLRARYAIKEIYSVTHKSPPFYRHKENPSILTRAYQGSLSPQYQPKFQNNVCLQQVIQVYKFSYRIVQIQLEEIINIIRWVCSIKTIIYHQYITKTSPIHHKIPLTSSRFLHSAPLTFPSVLFGPHPPFHLSIQSSLDQHRLVRRDRYRFYQMGR